MCPPPSIPRHHFVRGRLMEVDRHHPGSGGCESLGRGPTDPARSAGDNHPLSFESGSDAPRHALSFLLVV